MTVRLEYRPCSCSAYVQDQVVTRDDDGMLTTNTKVQQTHSVVHFDFPEVAAARVRDNVKDGVHGNVHHQGLHVAAAWIGDVRYPEEGEL